MTTGERIALGLGCTLTSAAFATFVVTACHWGQGGLYIDSPELKTFPFFAVCSLPGLLCAIPFILKLRDAYGAHFWTMLLSGTAIGPVLMGALFLVCERGDSAPLNLKDLLLCVGFGALVSFPTSLQYVVALRVWDAHLEPPRSTA